ncbi:MAG TPA: FAD-binding and (Fe-S)-binding domain-containing protein [Bryobacteraceae bacterium]|nr:FAD-binding and (Fe-S)-binding domain-containing protein [Bryobacteraceae bacterium]
MPGTLDNIRGPARERPDDKPPRYAEELARELRRKIEGEVRFDNGSRALYSTDGSNYRQVPIGVVVPRGVDDIVQTVAACRAYGAPILARGGGTSLAGQCCNIAVVIDCSKYMRSILELNPREKWARVQPGVVLDDLRNAAEKHHLTFAPDPATHNHCTLGGMMGNNSCGTHSLMGGKTDDNTEELEVLTYDGLRMRVGKTSEEELGRIIAADGRRGEIYGGMKHLRDRYAVSIRERFPEIPRRVSGYNLPFLLPEKGFDVAKALIGSESTLAFILEAKLRLVASPRSRSLLVLGYPGIFEAADHVMEILESRPIALEAIDDYLVRNMGRKGLHTGDLRFLPEGKGWLLVEFGGENRRESDARAGALMARLKKDRQAPSMKLYDDPAEEKLVWQIRESGLGATAFVPGEPVTWEGWEDSSVPPPRMGRYLRELKRLYEKHNYVGALYGHFGQGCLHTRINFNFKTAEGIASYRSFMREAAELCISLGGSLSGEHGDGQSRAELLPLMYGPEIVRAFGELKAIWDPHHRMNPGKVVYPYRIDENLRHGLDYNPPQLKTHFRFAEEGGWSGAVDRCVGVGECRRETAGTMCPSYMATHEEKHSTRGRSRLLFEMLQGQVFDAGWKSEEVFEALDLCLSCKGCKGDCPVNVDMATYKAEFLSHYYEGRPRPRQAYSMGLIFWWARLASKAPHLVNFVSHAPGLSNLVKALGGISQRRRMPAFAGRTFKAWFRARARRNVGAPPVVLWADTFNNYFHPRTAQAAVEVLEAAGFHVQVPAPNVCCGRPLYDYGMLDAAENLLLETMDALRPAIRSGTPVVGLEPSCVAVFRDELRNLFPDDLDAERLSHQTFTLAEFLETKAGGYKPPTLRRKALLHGHCHQKAIMKLNCEERLLRALGLELEVLDSGCCGMAGSFGFESGKYDLSMKCGERVLLPAVRRAAKDTLILADGFSCREQIAQATGRSALHIAQVLQMALRQGDHGPHESQDEEPAATGGKWAFAAAAALAAGAIYVARSRRR